jgi:hypothetical protein
MFLVACVTFPVAAWWAENPTSAYRSLATIAACSVLVATVYDLSGAYRRALAGIVSEQRVLAAIRDSSAAVVVNGAKLDERAGDIDHVVLGPMAAIVETKTGAGAVTIQGDQLRCNARLLRGASLRKVRAQADAIGRLTGVSVTPVLCVVNMEGGPLTAGAVVICSADELPGVLDGLPQALDESQARTFGRSLTPR